MFHYAVGSSKSLKDLKDLDVIRKEARFFYRTISGVLLHWKLEEPKGPKVLSTEGRVVGPCWEK
jgi:hypothetical protein